MSASDYDCGPKDLKRKFPSKKKLKFKIKQIDNILDSLIKYKIDLDECLWETERSIRVYSDKKEKYLILLSAVDMSASLIDEDWDENGTLKIEHDWDSNGTLKFDHSIISDQSNVNVNDKSNILEPTNINDSLPSTPESPPTPKQHKHNSSINKWIKKSIYLKQSIAKSN